MPDTTATMELLRRTSLLGDVSAEVLDRVAGLARMELYDEGDALYHLGDDAADVYVVAEGRVRFTLGVGNRGGASGSIMAAGQVFGWAALLEDQPRRLATAVCLEPSQVLAIGGCDLLSLFEDDTAAGYAVMRQLAAMITRNFMEVLAS